VFILAPHGDDELLGCGGWLLLACRRQFPVTVVFIERRTPERRAEGDAALFGLDVTTLDLGLDAPFSDQSLTYADELMQHVDELDPQVILAPFKLDPHPMHRWTNDLAISIHKKSGVSMLEYETLTPLCRAMRFLDISDVIEEKMERLSLYALENQRYRIVTMAQSLAQYRACVSLRRSCMAAEAYYETSRVIN